MCYFPFHCGFRFAANAFAPAKTVFTTPYNSISRPDIAAAFAACTATQISSTSRNRSQASHNSSAFGGCIALDYVGAIESSPGNAIADLKENIAVLRHRLNLHLD